MILLSNVIQNVVFSLRCKLISLVSLFYSGVVCEVEKRIIYLVSSWVLLLAKSLVNLTSFHCWKWKLILWLFFYFLPLLFSSILYYDNLLWLFWWGCCFLLIALHFLLQLAALLFFVDNFLRFLRALALASLFGKLMHCWCFLILYSLLFL